jgi:uncharacterized membrane protein YeaQ/YmgE (transglycosylase-associated protein family)
LKADAPVSDRRIPDGKCGMQAGLEFARSVVAGQVLSCRPRPASSVEERNEGAVKMGIIGWIVFGLIVGAIAKLVMPGRDPGGIVVTMLLGIIGALLGGFLGRALGLYGPDDAAGFLMSTLGAVVVLGLYRLAVGRRAVAH